MALTPRARRFAVGLIPAAMLVILIAIGLLTLHNAHDKPFEPDHTTQVNFDPEGFTLKHVMIVHRHGLRAPAKLSNWSNPNDFPMGLGFLTRKGKQDSLRVGRVLRKFYSKFLSDTPREVWARSSTYQRCFETEQLVLSAMYPPRGIWDFGFVAQPVPITMVPDGNDVYIESCDAPPVPDFKHIYNETNAALLSDGFKTVAEFIAWVTSVSGYPSDTSEFYDPIIDAFYAQKLNGLAIPDWAAKKWTSMDWAMRRLSYEYWLLSVPYYGQYMAKTIAERTKGAAEGKIKSRLSIMSYHDTTLQALLRALRLDSVELYPSFLAALHFQLYQRNSDGAHFVRMMYHQGVDVKGHYREAQPLAVPDCLFPDCPLDKFVNLLNNSYPDVNRTACNPVNLKALL